jgi:mono/diheme cytochrome c family protein
VKIFRAIALILLLTGITFCRTNWTSIFAASTSSGDTAPGQISSAGAKVYAQRCALCHGEHMEGIQPAFPSLTGVGRQMNAEQLTLLLHQGRGRMPAFTTSQLPAADLASLLQYLAADRTFNTAPANSPAATEQKTPAPFDAGGSIYQQNCAFCHGRDAGGGESGPDLTRSKLVATDVGGDQIGPVVRNGRPDNKMPKFILSDVEMLDLVKFIHAQAKLAASRPGGRRGVDVADLQTGNVAAGEAYFNGPGRCSSCHSPTGDLAGVASRYQGLQLEERMLYPRDARDTITVTLPSGEIVKGRLEYQDEFTVGLRDPNGTYRSWPVSGIKYTIDSPVSAHVDQFAKYTDDDIHNLMAYIQTLK